MSSFDLVAATPLLLYLTFGLVYCFFGYRFIKGMLIAFGCFAGLAIGLQLGYALLPESPLGLLVLGALGAVAGAILFALVFKLALFSAGFAAGSILAPVLVSILRLELGSAPSLVIVALSGLVVGMIALLLERQVMILISAALGAVVTTVSTQMLIARTVRLDSDHLRAAYERAFTSTWWLLLILFGLGAIFQWRTTGKRRE